MRIRLGLGISRKMQWTISNCNLLRFSLRKIFLGFEYANILLGRLDKKSVQLILKKNGATIGKECDIESGLTFHNCKDYANLTIGDHCHIGKNCFFDLRNQVTIGNNVTVSMACRFITHLDAGKSRVSDRYPPKDQPIIIESHAYLGAGVTVLMGSRIGKAAVVAAGSLVNSPVPEGVIAAGRPAIIKKKKPSNR